MSTRAVIARPTEEGWEGVYHHSDGYPTSLGKLLHKACRQYFGKDHLGLAAFVIDAHLGGWSSLGSCDPNHPNIGYIEPGGAPSHEDREAHDAWFKEYAATPKCYCHGDCGDRADDRLYTQADQEDAWDIEWTYFITEDKLLVFEGCGEMRPVGEAYWDMPTEEIDWQSIECGEHLERCNHVVWKHFEDAPEESKQLAARTYLGYEPLEPRDAIAYLIDGVRYEKGGSGHSEGWYVRPDLPASSRRFAGEGERANGNRWFQSMKGPDGTERVLPVWYQTGKRKGEWCEGVEPIYPPIKEGIHA